MSIHFPAFRNACRSYTKQRSGFTLLELLIVTLVMVVLAALVLGSMQYAKKRAALARTEAFMELIKTQLTQYQLDYGSYPDKSDAQFGMGAGWSYGENIGGGNYPEAIDAVVLYRVLSGDYDGNGSINGTERAGIDIMETLNPGEVSSDYRVKQTASGLYYLCDAYEVPIQYRRGDQPGAINTDSYDLWSFADSGVYSGASNANWIKNW